MGRKERHVTVQCYSHNRQRENGQRKKYRETDQDRRMLWLWKIPFSNRRKRLSDKGNSFSHRRVTIIHPGHSYRNGWRKREKWERDGGKRRKDGPKRNRAEKKEKPERSGQTGMSSARLSILSRSVKNSLIQPSDRCLQMRRDFQTSFNCLMFSFCSEEWTQQMNHKNKLRSKNCIFWALLKLTTHTNTLTHNSSLLRASGKDWYCYHTPPPPPSWQKKSLLKSAKSHITQQFPDANMPLQTSRKER